MAAWIFSSSRHELQDPFPSRLSRLSSCFLPYDESRGALFLGKRCFLVFHDVALLPLILRAGKAGEVSYSCSHTTLTLDINHNQSALHAIIASLSGFEALSGISMDTTWWLTDEPAGIYLSGKPEFGWIMECSCNICALTEKSLRNPSIYPVWYLHMTFYLMCHENVTLSLTALTYSLPGSSTCATFLAHL